MATHSYFGYTRAAFDIDAETREIRLAADYHHARDRVRIDIEDDDAAFDGDRWTDERGDDADQTATVSDPQGNQTHEGAAYSDVVHVLQHPDGHEIHVTRVEIGGEVVGYLTSEPLERGTDYHWASTHNSHAAREDDPATDRNEAMRDTRPEYDDFQSVPCFAPGMRVATARGAVPVQWLRVGDLVRTRDHGLQPVVWTGCRRARAGGPVRIAPGALAPGVPACPLALSPQHRVTVEGAALQLGGGVGAAFAPASALAGCPGIVCVGPGDHLWHHLLLPCHAQILVEGAWVESLFLGSAVAELWRGRIPAALFQAFRAGHARTALPCLSHREARAFARMKGPDGRGDLVA